MKKRAHEPKTQSGAARPKRGIASVHGILYRTFTLRFLDAEVEEKFEEHHYHQNWQHIRLVILLSILVFVLFGAVDYILLPDEYLRVWGIRLLAYVPFSMLMLILTYTKEWRLAFTAGPFAILIAGVSLIVPISGNPLHGSPEYFVAMLLFLLFGYTLLRVRYVWMVRAGLAMTLIYELVLLYLSPVDTETFLVSTLFLIAANSIGMTAAYAIERFARRDFVQTMLLADSADTLALSISYRDQHIKQFIAAAADVVLFRLSGDTRTKQVTVVEHSQALLDVLGVAEDQSKDLAQWFIHAEKPSEVAGALSKTVLGGGHYRADVTVILPEKGKRSLQLLVVAAEDVFDGRRSALGILIDLTDERQQQERQAMLLDQKTKFLEITGHQLNTPLNMMKWGLEALAGSGGDVTKVDQLMRGMTQATDRMTRVLHDVFSALALAEHVPLAAVAPTQGIALFELARKRFGEVRRLKLPSERQLEGMHLVADAEKIAFVIERLIENALDYSEHGDVIAEATITGDKLVVRVEDEGIGVPPSERPFIFQLFYRGEQAVTMQPNRSGISLYLAKAYIEAHGGRLRLDTSVPSVTAFVFEVPLAPQHT